MLEQVSNWELFDRFFDGETHLEKGTLNFP